MEGNSQIIDLDSIKKCCPDDIKITKKQYQIIQEMVNDFILKEKIKSDSVKEFVSKICQSFKELRLIYTREINHYFETIHKIGTLYSLSEIDLYIKILIMLEKINFDQSLTLSFITQIFTSKNICVNENVLSKCIELLHETNNKYIFVDVLKDLFVPELFYAGKQYKLYDWIKPTDLINMIEILHQNLNDVEKIDNDIMDNFGEYPPLWDGFSFTCFKYIQTHELVRCRIPLQEYLSYDGSIHYKKLKNKLESSYQEEVEEMKNSILYKSLKEIISPKKIIELFHKIRFNSLPFEQHLYHKKTIKNKDGYKAAYQFVKKQKLNITVDIPSDHITLTVINNRILLEFAQTSDIKFHHFYDERRPIESSGQTKFIRSIIFYNMDPRQAFLLLEKQNKVFPLSLKEVSKICSLFPNADRFFKSLFENLAKEELIFKDIVRSGIFDKYPFFSLLPISISECVQAKNPKQLFMKLYKNAEKYPAPWNKMDLNLSYIYLKTASRIKEKSQNLMIGYLRDLPKSYAVRNVRKWHIRDIPSNIIKEYYNDRCKVYDSPDPHDETYIISDYVNMVYDIYQKIDLSYSSFNRIHREHNLLADRLTMKRYPQIKISKRSRFHKLRKMLPKKEFHWICTIEDLIKEGKTQHNCVATYHPLIQKDVCAIYAATINGNRYTLEFRYENKQFVLVQIFKAYNVKAEKNDIEYIDSLLEEGMKK